MTEDLSNVWKDNNLHIKEVLRTSNRIKPEIHKQTQYIKMLKLRAKSCKHLEKNNLSLTGKPIKICFTKTTIGICLS